MKGANIHAETDFNCPARHPLGNRNGIDSDQSNRLTPDTRKRKECFANEKLTPASKELWSILIAGVAAALCAAVDIILKDDENENFKTGTK